MKCTHNTLTSLLSAWDKLEVVGINPDNYKSILTSTLVNCRNDFGKRQVKVAIEYRIEEITEGSDRIYMPSSSCTITTDTAEASSRMAHGVVMVRI